MKIPPKAKVPEKMKGAFLPPPKPARILKPIQPSGCIHVYDGHESKRCLKLENKF